MNRRALLFRLAAATGPLSGCLGVMSPKPTQVMVIASLHGAHKDHPTYPYSALYGAVRAFAPDAVGVEIRQEDLGRDAAYLAANYPQEMVELARTYGPRAFGFDWLGPELEGRAVPEGYWRNESRVKRLERRMAADKSVGTPLSDAVQARQLTLIKTVPPASLNDGRYDALNREYYRLLAKELAGTPYAALPRFYARRDKTIARNIVEAVRRRRGQRIAIVLGADHRELAVRMLRRLRGVELVEVT